MSGLPAEPEANSTSEQVDGRARPAPRFKANDLVQAASAAAGTAAIIYVVGGMVMWLRFRKAGLPPDHAVALMERQQLLVIGLRLMVLPAALTGALAWLVMRRRGRARRPPSTLLAVWKAGLLIIAAAFALLLPFSFASATWVLAALLVLGYLRYERRPPGEPRPAVERGPPRTDGRAASAGRARELRGRAVALAAWAREIWARARPHLPLRRRVARQASPLIATMLVVIVAALVSLGRQLDQPIQLLGATVSAKDPARTIEGVYISSDSDEIFIGMENEIRAIPRATVREVAIGPPRERAPSPSLISRALGRNRFAITPFEWWCNGERYGWGDVKDLCQTQIQLVKGAGQKVQRRDLAGDAVPMTLRCPPAAKKPCRGFLRMTSTNQYQFGPAGLPRPALFQARIRPIGASDTNAAGIAPGQARVMCLRVDNGQRGLLRNVPVAGERVPLEGMRGKRPIRFTVTITGDEEGRNVLRSEPFVVSVTRPDQPIEYWGECSTLRVKCAGAAGAKRGAAITCTITSDRRVAGNATVTISGGGIEYAAGAGKIDGTQLVVRPAVRQILPPGRYQAIVLLTRGSSARKFWTFFNVR